MDQLANSLEAFLEAVRHKKHGESVRIRQEDLRGASSVSALKLDLKYWPTYEITKVPEPAGPDGSSGRYTWHRRAITPDNSDGGSSSAAGEFLK